MTIWLMIQTEVWIKIDILRDDENCWLAVMINLKKKKIMTDTYHIWE